MKRRGFAITVLRNSAAWLVGIAWLSPFVGVFLLSLQPVASLAYGWWDPHTWNFSFSNYIRAFTDPTIHLKSATVNTFLVSILGTIFPMVLGAPAAYALARYRLPFKRGWLVLTLVLLVIPFQMLAIPVFKIMRNLRLINTLTSVIIMDTATALPWIIYFMMNFFRVQPVDAEEAARLDGAGRLGVFLFIALPQAIPALASVFVLQFIWCWIDFFLPLIFLYTPDKYVIMQIIPLQIGQFRTAWGVLAALCVYATSIPLLVFAVLQKYYVKGQIGWFGE